MILPIYVYGQPVLRKEAEDITPDYPNLKEFDFLHRCLRHQHGGSVPPDAGLPLLGCHQ